MIEVKYSEATNTWEYSLFLPSDTKKETSVLSGDGFDSEEELLLALTEFTQALLNREDTSLVKRTDTSKEYVEYYMETLE